MARVFYSEEEDNYKEESVNKYKDIFSEYEKKIPTLSEALSQMFISSGADMKKANGLIKDILSKCKETIDDNLEKIKEKNDKITKEDAYIICSYTCETEEGEYNPYRILNTNLVSKNRRNGIKNISKYLYIFLKSLRKLEIYKTNILYRCITHKVSLTDDPFNKNYIPYKIGNTKTFWGFTSTSPNPKTSFSFLKDDIKKEIKTGTLFFLEGEIWGYDISLFNYYGEEEILLEPERKYIIDKVIPNLNEITQIHCKLLKTNLVLDNNNIYNNIYNKKEEEKIENNIINNNIIINNEIKKNICKIEMEIKKDDKYIYIQGIGFLCNINSKNMKVLITYNHIINLEFLNNEKKLIYINNNNEKKEINMKINRFKYTNKELDITIIEILDKEENEENYIEIDEYINSRDYKEEEIYIIGYNKRKLINIEIKIIEKKNEYFICNKNINYGGMIILEENNKLRGIIKENEINNDKIYIPMNKIINKINYIKCIYEIKKEDIGK